MKRFSAIILMLILGLGLAGCNTAHRKMEPPCTKVLVYQLPYDLTYLRVMEALDGKGKWQLEETDKEKGLISLRETDYKSLDDSDVPVIVIEIKRVDRATTSVALAPKSQAAYSGAVLMKKIDEALSRETQS